MRTPPLHPQPRTLAWLARRVERALADVGLSLPEYRMLSVIADDAAGSSQLAGRLAVSKPRITALADRLDQLGYLERRTHPDDRRRVEHVLTEAGRDKLRAADAAAASSVDRLLAELEPDEVTAVEHSFELLARALISSRGKKLGADATSDARGAPA